MISTVTSNEFNTIINIFEKDAGPSKPEHWVSFNRFFISSGVNEFMLKINAFSEELVIARIEVHQKRNGVESETLSFLKNYAKANGFKRIIVESVMTDDMKRFVHHNGFVKQECTFGNFELLI